MPHVFVHFGSFLFSRCVTGSSSSYTNVNFDRDSAHNGSSTTRLILVHTDNLNIFKNVLLFCV
jgi:hypothetical protein